MKPDREQYVRRIMSGEARGIGASLLRGTLRFCEPFYALAMRISNGLYELEGEKMGEVQG